MCSAGMPGKCNWENLASWYSKSHDPPPPLTRQGVDYHVHVPIHALCFACSSSFPCKHTIRILTHPRPEPPLPPQEIIAQIIPRYSGCISQPQNLREKEVLAEEQLLEAELS